MLKAFCSWSGGKESALSLYRAKKEGISIKYLLNMITEDGKHSRSHGLSKGLLKQQAENIGIPILQPCSSWQTYESEFKKAVGQLKMEGIEIGIFGDIDMEEHRVWVERVGSECGIKPILPLWDSRRDKLLKEFIESEFSAIVVSVNTSFLGKEWLGRCVDNKFISDLKGIANVDICGEKGEYHTFVYNGPIFKKPMEIIIRGEILKDNYWFLEIEGK